MEAPTQRCSRCRNTYDTWAGKCPVCERDRVLAGTIRGGRGDPEVSHAEADRLIIALLREIGYTRTADEFDALEKRYA